jgi:hypothetical protein
MANTGIDVGVLANILSPMTGYFDMLNDPIIRAVLGISFFSLITIWTMLKILEWKKGFDES